MSSLDGVMDLPVNSNNCHQPGAFKILQKILLKVGERIDSRENQRCPEPNLVIETVRRCSNGYLGEFFISFSMPFCMFVVNFCACTVYMGFVSQRTAGGLPNTWASRDSIRAPLSGCDCQGISQFLSFQLNLLFN